jgi:hypothetical protein
MKVSSFLYLLLSIPLTAVGNGGKTFNELLQEKKILGFVPNEIVGIWRGKLAFQPKGDSDERDHSINLCQYPIQAVDKRRTKLNGKWQIYHDMLAIESIKKVSTKTRTYFSIRLETFTDGKAIGSGTYELYYHPKTKTITEEGFADNGELRWKMEYKISPCPNQVESRKKE